MQWTVIVILMAIPLLAAIYTFNYGRWALRQGLLRGAVGLFLLAVLTVVVPGLMLLVPR